MLGPGRGGTLVVRDLHTGRVDYWIRGFTYKAWICAETLKVIPGSTRRTQHWAWRVERPCGPKEALLRVKADVFDKYL